MPIFLKLADIYIKKEICISHLSKTNFINPNIRNVLTEIQFSPRVHIKNTFLLRGAYALGSRTESPLEVAES
jgi:hypothetical protein